MKWKNKINIKEYFTENPSDNDTATIIKILLSQLKTIKSDDEDLENIIGNFEILLECHDGKEIFEDFGYTNLLDSFNENLEYLYDIGDKFIGTKTKFIWVG